MLIIKKVKATKLFFHIFTFFNKQSFNICLITSYYGNFSTLTLIAVQNLNIPNSCFPCSFQKAVTVNACILTESICSFFLLPDFCVCVYYAYQGRLLTFILYCNDKV